MLFVLSNGFILNLGTIRTDYQQLAGITLDESKQPYAISRFFGAKDIKARNKQISFIEKWLMAFKKDLIVDYTDSEDVESLIKESLSAAKTAIKDEGSEPASIQSTAEAVERHLTAQRVLVTVCMYTMSQIDSTYTVRSGTSAILEQLINKAMGVNSINYIDEETRACCLLATKRYLMEKGRFESINTELRPRFTEKQWDDFGKFVTSNCDTLHEKYKITYPVTSVMMPLMGKPLELAGYTTGFILGEMVGKSTKLLRTRYALTAAIGSGLVLVMGPTASVGVMLLAPTYAGRILDTFCGVTLAWVLGAAGNVAGQGIGLGLGLSVDLGWKLMYNSFTLLARLYSGRGNHEKLNGISLVNGHRVIDGVELKLVDLDALSTQLPENYQLCPIAFEIDNETLKVTVNEEQTAIIPWEKDKKLPYLEELQKLFASQVDEKTLQHLNAGDTISRLAPQANEEEQVAESVEIPDETLNSTTPTY